MVYLRKIVGVRDKCFGHKPMDKNLPTFAVETYHNTVVTTVKLCFKYSAFANNMTIRLYFCNTLF